jgi:hypothetical protein
MNEVKREMLEIKKLRWFMEMSCTKIIYGKKDFYKREDFIKYMLYVKILNLNVLFYAWYDVKYS